MLEIKEWEEGIEAWKNIRKQAKVDTEQANLYIGAIEKKIEEVKKNDK